MILMLIWITTAIIAVESPVDIEITHPGAYVLLNWAPVTGVANYKVFTCDTPYGDFELDETGFFPTPTSWTKAEPAGKKFYRVTAVDGPLVVNLGTAANYAILAKAAISSVPASDITGHVGISPAAATYITGFTLTLDSSNVFSTSTQVTGKVYAADYADPTPINLTTAIGDLRTAYVDAAGRAPDITNLNSGDISGLTLSPGVYVWDGQVNINSSVTLNGGMNDVWIFQIAQGIVMSPNTSVILGGSAQAKNVFWQTFGPVDMDINTHMAGNVLCSTAIHLGQGASVNGRLLAETAVTLDQNVVTVPAP